MARVPFPMPGHFIFKIEHQKSQLGNKIPKMPKPVRSFIQPQDGFLSMAIFNLRLKTQLSLLQI